MRFERKDVVLAAIGVLLAIAGLMVDDILMVAVLLFLAAAIGCYAIILHEEKSCRFKAIVCLLIAVVAIFLFIRMYSRYEAKLLQSYTGTLYPAVDASPPIPDNCPIPRDALIIFFGSNVVWSTQSPYVILSIGGRPLLVLSRESNSPNLSITTLNLLDDRNDSIVSINNSAYWVNPFARMERPDSHTLVVYDHLNNEALHLRFLNRNTLSIQGTFNYPHHQPITSQDDELDIGRIHLTDACLGGSSRAFELE